MSTHFDKCEASDFCLEPINPELAKDPRDGSLWVKTHLYDFGWGKENGFYKTPLPDFNVLLDLVLHSPNMEDQYGAAAVILEYYPEKLLYECEMIIDNPCRIQDFKTLTKVFKLKIAINRCPIVKKTVNEIYCDYTRWENIANIASKTFI